MSLKLVYLAQLSLIISPQVLLAHGFLLCLQLLRKMIQKSAKFFPIRYKLGFNLLFESLFQDILNFGVIPKLLSIDIDCIVMFHNFANTFLFGIWLALTIDKFLQQVAIFEVEFHIPRECVHSAQDLLIVH